MRKSHHYLIIAIFGVKITPLLLNEVKECFIE